MAMFAIYVSVQCNAIQCNVRSKVCMALLNVRSKVYISYFHMWSNFYPYMEGSNADFALLINTNYAACSRSEYQVILVREKMLNKAIVKMKY